MSRAPQEMVEGQCQQTDACLSGEVKGVVKTVGRPSRVGVPRKPAAPFHGILIS